MTTVARWLPASRSALACAVAGLLAAQVGYAGGNEPPMPPTADKPWLVPDTARYSAASAGNREGADATGPAIDAGKGYELAELIDIAQRTNPETRVAWERAREAAFAVGIAESV